MKPLLTRHVRKQRRRVILPLVRGDVLDIGCGRAGWIDVLADDQFYVGVDIDQKALDSCSKRHPRRTFYRRNLDVEPLELGDHRFDTVIMAAVIEHLRSPEHVLCEVRSLLKPGGLFLVTTPSPFGDMVHKIGSRLGLFRAESDVGHVKIYGRRALLNIVTECGYEVVRFSRFSMGINQLVVCRSAESKGSR